MNFFTSEEDLNKFRAAAKITAKARDFGLKLIVPGAKLIDVAKAVEDEIRRLGGEPAFPAQISMNHIAAHYCSPPDDDLLFQAGDVAKLDVGAHVDGYVGDSAGSVDLGGHSMLVEASRQALKSALQAIKPGAPISEVGHAVNAAITGMGYKPVANLTGHAVGIYQVHGEPQIPNVPERNRNVFMKGQVLAVEPFATTGKGVVRERGQPEIFSVRGRLKMRKGMDEEVIEAIAAFKGLPFARRNLAERLPLERVNPTLAQLLKRAALHAYPPLTEAKGVHISQAEHTVYIGDEVEVLTVAD